MGNEWELVEALAERLRDGRDPPVDVREIARSQGVAVLDAPLHESGRLVPTVTGPAALLNRAEPEVRRRFTLAHELCHLAVLDHRVGGAVGVAVRTLFRSEEALCDAVAGALLMPRDKVRIFGDRTQTFATLRAVVDAFEVSWSAALVRMVDVCRWDRCLLEVIREDGLWTLNGEACLPSGIGMVRVNQETHWAIQLAGGLTPQMLLPLEVRGRRIVMTAELLRFGSRAMLLLDRSALARAATPTSLGSNRKSREMMG